MNHKLKQQELDKMLIKHMRNEPSHGEKFHVEKLMLCHSHSSKYYELKIEFEIQMDIRL